MDISSAKMRVYGWDNVGALLDRQTLVVSGADPFTYDVDLSNVDWQPESHFISVHVGITLLTSHGQFTLYKKSNFSKHKFDVVITFLNSVTRNSKRLRRYILLIF